MPGERPSYIPPENPFSSDEGKHPPEPTEQFVARYLGKRGKGIAEVAPSPTDLLTAEERGALEGHLSPETGERSRHYAEKAAELVRSLPNVWIRSHTEVVRALRSVDRDPTEVLEAAHDVGRGPHGYGAYAAAELALAEAEAGSDPSPLVESVVRTEAEIDASDAPFIFSRCARAYNVAGFDPVPLLTLAADDLPTEAALIPRRERLSDEYSIVLTTALSAREYDFAQKLVDQLPDSRAKVEALLEVADFKQRDNVVQSDELTTARQMLVGGLKSAISVRTMRMLLTEIATGFVAQGKLTAGDETMNMLPGAHWRGYADYALALARRGEEAGSYLTAVVVAARGPGAEQWEPHERAAILTRIAHTLVLLSNEAEAALEDAHSAVRALPDEADNEQASKIRALLRLSRVYQEVGRDLTPLFNEVRTLAHRREAKTSLVDLAYAEADLGYPADKDFAEAEKIARTSTNKSLSTHLVQRMARLAIKLAGSSAAARVQ